MKKHLLTNLEVGESRGIVRNYENGQVSVISIHSTKHVTFCSNFFGHENQKNSKSKLRIQQFYQDYMGGVDWFNSRINSLKFKHRWMNPKNVLLYYYLSNSMVNATTIFNQVQQTKTSCPVFMKAISSALIK